MIDSHQLYAARNALRLAEQHHEAVAASRHAQYLEPVGLEVEVVKGRKVPIGTRFVVQQAGEGKYGRWVRDGNGSFIDRFNVDIVDSKWKNAYAAELVRVQGAVDVAREHLNNLQNELLSRVAIDLRERTNVEHHSYGWREDENFDTSCNPHASDEEIALALTILDPQGSCWGALRWSCGTTLIARVAPDRIRVHSSTGLAD